MTQSKKLNVNLLIFERLIHEQVHILKIKTNHIDFNFGHWAGAHGSTLLHTKAH